MNSVRDRNGNQPEAAAEEQASLYVLGLLGTDEHRGFERRLASDSALRALVRDLQGNLDALVLAEPTRPAPLRVWGRIAAEVKSDQAPVVGFPLSRRRWIRNALAAAACVGAGFLLHAWWIQRTGADSNLAGVPEAVRTPAPTAPTPAAVPGAGTPAVVADAPPSRGADSNLVLRAEVATAEAARLRGEVRGLAAQVAALNRVLNQQPPSGPGLPLPAGMTRLHVFQLVRTNSLPGTESQGNPSTPPLPDLLARLAAGPPPSLSLNDAAPTPAPTGVSETPAATVPGAATPGPSALNGGQPLGFFDPDSGRGAIALAETTSDPDHTTVAWLQTTAPDGTATFQNLGAHDPWSPDNVIAFSLNTSYLSPSLTFVVTLEPSDVAATASVPTGQVVGTTPKPRP